MDGPRLFGLASDLRRAFVLAVLSDAGGGAFWLLKRDERLVLGVTRDIKRGRSSSSLAFRSA